GYMGQFGVAVFFMITGYLFGDIKKDTNWISFLIKRFFRVVPLTYISAIICISIATYVGIKLGNNADFSNVIYWFDGGLSGVKPPIYGFKDAQFIGAAVMWTLYWEWIFYFSLPLLSFAFNKTYTVGICIAAISILAHTADFLKIPLHHTSLLLFFAVGVLIKNLKVISSSHSIIKSTLASLILIYCLFVSNIHSAYNLTSFVLIGVFFLLVAKGGNLFGMLSTRGFVVLGDASYSIYLLHGIAWFIMNKASFHYGIQNKDVAYYAIQTFVWYAICFISLMSYKHFEKPFILYGKKVASKFEATCTKEA
ncbi:acyltransferase family protein, partial [Pantoea endophytica]